MTSTAVRLLTGMGLPGLTLAFSDVAIMRLSKPVLLSQGFIRSIEPPSEFAYTSRRPASSLVLTYI